MLFTHILLIVFSVNCHLAGAHLVLPSEYKCVCVPIGDSIHIIFCISGKDFLLFSWQLHMTHWVKGTAVGTGGNL